jgi:hypothetical protein
MKDFLKRWFWRAVLCKPEEEAEIEVAKSNLELEEKGVLIGLGCKEYYDRRLARFEFVYGHKPSTICQSDPLKRL